MFTSNDSIGAITMITDVFYEFRIMDRTLLVMETHGGDLLEI